MLTAGLTTRNIYMDTLSLLSDGNYFKEHPENDLSREFEFTDENGTVTKRRLTVDEALSKINAPIDRVVVPDKIESNAGTLTWSSSAK